MESAINIAKYFIKRNLDTERSTFDGNMKLQKLLFFANLISLLENDEPLFDEPMFAYKNGCVVEEVRLRYKKDNKNLIRESRSFEPRFSPGEYEILDLTEKIFGRLSARELSDLNHSFEFWKNAYNRSKLPDGHCDKKLALIRETEIRPELSKIKDVITTFKENSKQYPHYEAVNGKKFYYSDDFVITDEIIEELEDFTQFADDDAYSLYLDNGNLVIC